MNRFAALFLLLVSTAVEADILFVDLNNSRNELAEARREAQRRGERLVVVPRVANGDIASELRQAMTSQVNARKTFSTLILSGHYARDAAKNGYFYGDNGARLRMSYGTFNQIIRDPAYASLRTNFDSVLLWGCYTARPRAIADWHALFPRSSMIAGFNFAAPPDTALSSARVMRNLLRMGHDNIDDRRLLSRVREFTNFALPGEERHDYFNLTNLVVSLRGCYVSSRLGNLSERGLMECPPSLIQRLIRRRRQMYDPFANARASTPELMARARNHGETGLYRFKVDANQYANCLEMSDELPSQAEVNELCARFDCD